MPTYRVVTETGAVLGTPFTASTDAVAFHELDAHVASDPVRAARFIGIEVLVGASWLDAGLWHELEADAHAGSASAR